MKDQLKKIFSDASRQILINPEDIIKMEEAFMVEEINHLYFQDPYNLNELPLENEYNSFGDTPNQLSTDQNHDTYFNWGNHCNDQLKSNPINRPDEDNTTQRHQLSSNNYNIVEEEKTHVSLMVPSYVILVKIYIILPRTAQAILF